LLDLTEEYSTLWSDQPVNANPSGLNPSSDDEDGFGSSDGDIMSKFKRIPAFGSGDDDAECYDRRLPLQNFKRSGRFLYRDCGGDVDSSANPQTTLRKEPTHIQYVGELMVSNNL
jgi:hypothetical protein